MEEFPTFAKIATECLGGKDPGALNVKLYRFLEEANIMVRKAGGKMISRQVIVTLILVFKAEHPYSNLYNVNIENERG